jgi:FrmR/RcnR family transcriptional regulator, repressor of rcnA expression
VPDLCSQVPLCACETFSPLIMYPTRLGYIRREITHIDNEKQKLIAPIKRIRGQVDSIERILTAGDDCADVLMLLATLRGGINSLMPDVLEDYIRYHLLSGQGSSAPPQALAEDMIDLVRAYLN